MSKCPLLVCPECGSPLQHFAINLEENMFVCIGERKRDTFRGVVNQDTYNELKECSYPFSEITVDVSFFITSHSQTFKKAQQISEFLAIRREQKCAVSISDQLPSLILGKSYSYLCQALSAAKGCPNVSEVSTEDFCVNN